MTSLRVDPVSDPYSKPPETRRPATWGPCQRCRQRRDRGWITTSSGDLLVCLECYVVFTELPADHGAKVGPPVYGGLPTAPPGPIGTDQGAVKPDIPRFRWRKPR
jgi:hypothetical protein